MMMKKYIFFFFFNLRRVKSLEKFSHKSECEKVVTVCVCEWTRPWSVHAGVQAHV